MSELKIENGLIKVSDSYYIKDELRAAGCSFDRSSKTWGGPACDHLITSILEKIPGIEVSSDAYTLEVISKFKERRSGNEFLEKYLAQLKTGERGIDLSGMRFKEGIAPLAHQKLALDYIQRSDILALFWDCGLGKTFVVCQWLQYLKDNFNLQRGIVLAPRSTLHPTWVADLKKFTWLNPVVLDQGAKFNAQILTQDFPARSRKADPYRQKFDVFLINYESVTPLLPVLKSMEWDFMAVDESTKVKNPKAKRSKSIIDLADMIPRKVVMAGLPTPNGAADIFNQLRLLSPEFFGRSYNAFMGDHFSGTELYSRANGKNFTVWEVTPDGLNKIRDKIESRSVKLSMIEAGVNLPGSVYVTREALLPPAVYTQYKQMEDESVTYIKGQPLYAEGIASLMKLREFTSEFALDEEGVRLSLSETPAKIPVVQEILEDEVGLDQEGKQRRTLIWAHFVSEYDDLKKALGKEAICMADFKDPKDPIEMFKRGDKRILIANPASLGHGVTLVECASVIWYSYNYSSEEYYQANKRVERIGQSEKAVIYHVVGIGPKRQKTIDNALMQVVYNKLENNNSLMSAITDILGS